MAISNAHSSLLDDLDRSWAALREDGYRLDAGGDRGDLLLAITRFKNQLDAFFSQVVARFDKEEDYARSGALNAAAWMRHHLHLAPSVASNQVRTARRLKELGHTREAFEKGDLSFSHASLIARTVEEVGNQPNPEHEDHAEQPENLDAMLTAFGTQMHPYDLVRACKHAKEVLRPDLSLQESEQQRAQQYLELSQTIGGMWHLQGLFAPEEGTLLATALDAAMPRLSRADRRGVTERRAEGLVDLARRVLDSGELPAHDGERPHLSLLVDLATLRGEPGSPAIIDRTGQPVPGKVAERIACDCALTPIVTGENGDVLHVGRRQRLFSPKQSLAMAIRDRTCRFPGCDRLALWCANHHLVPWWLGGPTDLENGAKLCHRHHRMCHDGGWTLRKDPDTGEFLADPPP